MTLNVLSLFAGIGGLELGLERAGMTTVGQVEIDDYCQQVLARHWPEVPRHDDVRTAVEWWRSQQRPRVDIVCGGPPCQPFSLAGRQLGIDDERWMWPAMAHVVREIRPRYVLVENVSALVRDRVAFGIVLADLAALGFDASWSVVSACSLGAPHTRERVFVLAYPAGDDGEQPLHLPAAMACGCATARAAGGEARGHRWLPEPDVCGMADGIPARMDGERLDADATEDRYAKDMRPVREAAGQAAQCEWSPGGPIGLSEAEVLQSEVHGGRPAQRRSDCDLHAEVPEGVLRDLWENIAARCSSQGRGSIEQLVRELADALRAVPHIASLGERQAVAEAGWYLCSLREAGTQSGILRDASFALAEEWQSLSREEADWLHMAACRGPWTAEWPGVKRVAHGLPKRLVAPDLHALGNAVCPPVAEHIGQLILAADRLSAA